MSYKPFVPASTIVGGAGNDTITGGAGTNTITGGVGNDTITGGAGNNVESTGLAMGGIASLGGYSDGGQLLRGPGDGVSDDIPATIGDKQPARLADGEFVVPARIVSELGNGSTEAGARKLYAMMDRIKNARSKAKNIAANTKADKHLPA
jgi:Ca2+-binding RTX toxin-like protein